MKTVPQASNFKRSFIRQHSESILSCLELVWVEFGKADESKYWKNEAIVKVGTFQKQIIFWFKRSFIRQHSESFSSNLRACVQSLKKLINIIIEKNEAKSWKVESTKWLKHKLRQIVWTNQWQIWVSFSFEVRRWKTGIWGFYEDSNSGLAIPWLIQLFGIYSFKWEPFY